MMMCSEKNAFIFSWQIQNFSMCPHLFGEYMYSPTFVVHSTEWTIKMYPRGNIDRYYLACYLERNKSIDKDEDITIAFEFVVHSVHPEKDIRHKVKQRLFKSKSGESWGYNDFCLREDILNSTNGFLPKDILTIECRIWGTIDAVGTVLKSPDPVSGDLNLAFSDSALQEEMRTTAARNEFLHIQTRFASRNYLARTCVRVGRKCVFWPIGRVSELRPDQRLSIPIDTAGISAPTFAMTLYLSGESVDDQCVQIEIQIEESNLEKVCFVRCRISAVNGSMKAQHVGEDEHFFEPTKENDAWKFPIFIQTTTLVEEKYLDATQGNLILRCEFAYSSKGDEFHIEEIDAVLPFLSRFPKPIKGEFNGVQSMCQQVYEEQLFSDVALRTGGRSFKAHKNILSSRSRVFRAMFESDMRENESGVVDITDYDPDTVEQLLTFIYINSVEDLEQKNAMELYSLADKYEVLSLKWHCSNHIKSILSNSNVCEVLTLADLHQDGDLLDHVKNYISRNSDFILHSQMWKDLMKSNGSLASQVMLDLLTGNMGHL